MIAQPEDKAYDILHRKIPGGVEYAGSMQLIHKQKPGRLTVVYNRYKMMDCFLQKREEDR